jgi:small Trp-rich protein
VWWQVADASGWSKRKAMEKEDRVKLDRQERIRKRLEQGTKGKR